MFMFMLMSTPVIIWSIIAVAVTLILIKYFAGKLKNFRLNNRQNSHDPSRKFTATGI